MEGGKRMGIKGTFILELGLFVFCLGLGPVTHWNWFSGLAVGITGTAALIFGIQWLVSGEE